MEGGSGPERMRQAVAGYVAAAHRAYLTQAQLLPPAQQGSLPLLAGGAFWVAAAGVRDLHVIATRQPLGPPRGQEVEVDGSLPPLRWSLRFYDPVVLPELGFVTETGAAACDAVRRVLGVRTWLYHLVVQPGAELGEHHAGHAGTALVQAHAAAARDFEAIRVRAGGRERLVTEMEGAAQAGLVHAQALLAQAIAPGDPGVEAEAARPEPDPEGLRRAVLAAVGHSTSRRGP